MRSSCVMSSGGPEVVGDGEAGGGADAEPHSGEALTVAVSVGRPTDSPETAADSGPSFTTYSPEIRARAIGFQ